MAAPIVTKRRDAASALATRLSYAAVVSDARAEAAEQLALAGAVSASLAHELRNMLAVMESSVFLARRQRADPERAERHLAVVSDQIRKAHALTGSVLALARGEPVCRDPLVVSDLIDEALTEVASSPAGAATVSFERDIQPTDLVVMGEPLLLGRVLVNLYSNAVAALGAHPSARVVTQVRRDGDALSFRITDNGPGIPLAIRSTLFEPLTSAREGGTGLGLALCRAVVRAHRGDIESVERDKGAEFRFWLPC